MKNNIKVYLCASILIFSNINVIHSEENVVSKLFNSVVNFISQPFKKTVTLDVNVLDQYSGAQKDYYTNQASSIIDKNLASDDNNPNLYLEKSLLENIKGNKEKAALYASKVKELVVKKPVEQSLTDVRNQIRSKEVVKEEVYEFEFDESLVLMLANEFSDQYDVGLVRVAMVNTSKRTLSQAELDAELKKTADRFYAGITSAGEAKDLIEKCIAEEEYVIGLDVLERALIDKYLETDYYDVKKLFFTQKIAEMKEIEEAARKAKEEQERKIAEEKAFLEKLYSEEEKKLAEFKAKFGQIKGMFKWTSLVGTKLSDSGQALSIGVDGIYLTGYTYSNMPGFENAGDSDMFITKMDFIGNIIWTRQLGSAGSDVGTGVIAAEDGVYVSGYTNGAFGGGTPLGETDYFVAKYNLNGKLLWNIVDGSDKKDRAKSIAVSKDAVYVVGSTNGSIGKTTNAGQWDIFVTKASLGGKKIWTKLIGGNSFDEGSGIAVIDDEVYIAGHTMGAVDGQKSNGQSDIVVSKIDSEGVKKWTRMIGTSKVDYGYSIAGGLDAIYITGETKGDYKTFKNKGESDVITAKIDVSGNIKWIKLLGSDKNDFGYYIFTRLDSVYVTGRTKGTLGGQKNSGGSDVFISKYDLNGNQLFTKVFGTAGDDECYGLTVGLDFLYITGETRGNLFGKKNNGGLDAFVIMMSEEE